MIILDTNILSETMRTAPEPVVVAWLNRQPRASVWLTAISVFEIRLGLSRLPMGLKRLQLEAAFERGLTVVLGGRILPFDEAAAREAGDLAARRQQRGINIDIRDTQIAGIALVHRATLATRNQRHFADLGLPLVNPWATSPPVPTAPCGRRSRSTAARPPGGGGWRRGGCAARRPGPAR